MRIPIFVILDKLDSRQSQLQCNSCQKANASTHQNCRNFGEYSHSKNSHGSCHSLVFLPSNVSRNNQIRAIVFCKYSQTWPNGHLWIATPCIHDTHFKEPILTFISKLYLWTTTTCIHQPQFWGPKADRCTQVWLYVHINNILLETIQLPISDHI